MYVFSCLLKESAGRNGVGRAFHRLGALTSKAQSPQVLKQVRGTDHKLNLFDPRARAAE